MIMHSLNEIYAVNATSFLAKLYNYSDSNDCGNWFLKKTVSIVLPSPVDCLSSLFT